jgi:hypothetical protein
MFSDRATCHLSKAGVCASVRMNRNTNNCSLPIKEGIVWIALFEATPLRDVKLTKPIWGNQTTTGLTDWLGPCSFVGDVVCIPGWPHCSGPCIWSAVTEEPVRPLSVRLYFLKKHLRFFRYIYSHACDVSTLVILLDWSYTSNSVKSLSLLSLRIQLQIISHSSFFSMPKGINLLKLKFINDIRNAAIEYDTLEK